MQWAIRLNLSSGGTSVAIHSFEVDLVRSLPGDVIKSILRECWAIQEIEAYAMTTKAALAVHVTVRDHGIWEWNEEIIPATAEELASC